MQILTVTIAGKPGASPIVLARHGNYAVAEPMPIQGKLTELRQAEKKLETFIRDGTPEVDADALQQIGRLLFSLVFTGDVNALYRQVLGRADDAMVRVDIGATDNAFRKVPWEFMYDPDQNDFVVWGQGAITRHLIGLRPVAATDASPASVLRVLIAVAAPSTQAELDWKEESKLMLRSFEPLIKSGRAQVDVIEATTPSKLMKALSAKKYQVLHFIGHGEFRKDRAYILLERSAGGEKAVEAGHFAHILTKRGIQLVVLNACDSAALGASKRAVDFNVGVAPALIARGVKAVMGNQYPVPDQGALKFSELFYHELTMGASLDEAMQRARLSMTFADEAYVVDWGIPTLYTDQEPAPLLKPPTKKDATTPVDLQDLASAPHLLHAVEGAAQPPAAAALPTLLREVGTAATGHLFRAGRLKFKVKATPKKSAAKKKEHVKTILLADLNSRIGYLAELAERLTALQDYFEFRVANFMYPVGSELRIDGALQFDIMRIRDQAERQVEKAGADFLVGFTRYFVRSEDEDEEWWNLMADARDEFAVVSTKELRTHAKKAGRSFEYAVANLLAGQLLVNFDSGIDDYHDDANACLMDFCEDWNDRIAALKAGKIQACCRPRIKNRRIRKAIEAILDDDLEV